MTDLWIQAFLNLSWHLGCCFFLPLWLQRRWAVRETWGKIFLALIALILAVHPISAFASFFSRTNPDVMVAAPILGFFATDAGQTLSLRQRNMCRIPLVILVSLFAVRPVFNILTEGAPQFDSALGLVAAIGHSVVALVWPSSSTGVRGFAYTLCPEGVVFDRPALIAGWLVIAVTITLTVATVMRRRLYPWLMDAALFVVPLMLVIVGTPDGPFAVNERRLYVPLIGMCVLIARAGIHAMRAGIVARTCVLLIGSMFAVALGTSTVVYARLHPSPYALRRFQYQREPQNPVFARQLSEELIQKDQRSRALAILRRGHKDALRRCDHSAEADLGLRAMAELVHVTSDLDQAQLMNLRIAYDRLLAQGSVRLQTAELTLEIPKVHARQVVALDEARYVALPRALTYVRTMELSAAEQQLLHFVQSDRTNQDAWALLALVYARQSKWTQLERVLSSIAQLRQRCPPLQGIVDRVTRAKALAQTRVQGDVSTAIRDAQVQLILQAPEAARRLLDPAFQWTPTHRELVLTYAQTYIDDRRRDLAVQLIQRTHELDPRHAEFWTQALSRVKTQASTQ